MAAEPQAISAAVEMAPRGVPGDRLTGPGTPPRSAAERVASFDVADFPVPGGREEDWRFTPLKRLRGLLDGTPSDAHLKWSTDLPGGVTVEEIAAADPLRTTVPAPIDRPSVLAHANAGGAVVLRVPADAQPDRPAVLELTGSSVEQPVWGHVIVEVGANASATVVLDHSGSATYSGLL